MTVTRSLGPRSSVPPLGARRKQRVSADTLRWVAAAQSVRGRLHGRRATAAAVVRTACLLMLTLLLLMLPPDHGRDSLAAIVVVRVGIVRTVLTLHVAGVGGCVDYPPVA